MNICATFNCSNPVVNKRRGTRYCSKPCGKNEFRRIRREKLRSPDRECAYPGCSQSLSGRYTHTNFCSRKCSSASWWIEKLSIQFGIGKREIFDIQKRACEICGTPGPSSIDHNHATGCVRGSLCNSDNIALGHMGDDPDRAYNASIYLYKDRDILGGMLQKLEV